MRTLDDIFAALSRSSFRRRQRLGQREAEYLQTRGLPLVVEHARDLIARRLAPANPRNDGKQTPFKGHPVFIAQHATATCCRGCLEKLHGIPRGRELTGEEQDHVVAAIERWLLSQEIYS
ncbi:MAG TPA: DUF4186 domain-containing protein [Gemmatimonadaceae bacterium]|jgi:hypothetical protein